MSATYRNLIAWLIVVLVLSILLTCSGCSTVKIKACLPGAAECTVAKFKGDSSLDAPYVEYERCEGDNCVRLIFSADKTVRQAPTVSDKILDKLIDRAFGPIPE